MEAMNPYVDMWINNTDGWANVSKIKQMRDTLSGEGPKLFLSMHPRVNTNAQATCAGSRKTELPLMCQGLDCAVTHAAPIPAPGYQ